MHHLYIHKTFDPTKKKVNNGFLNLEISLGRVQFLEHTWWNLGVFFEVVVFFLKFGDILVEIWWHFGGSLVAVWWKFGGSLVAVWWKFGGSLVEVWWKFGGSLVAVLVSPFTCKCKLWNRHQTATKLPPNCRQTSTKPPPNFHKNGINFPKKMIPQVRKIWENP